MSNKNLIIKLVDGSIAVHWPGASALAMFETTAELVAYLVTNKMLPAGATLVAEDITLPDSRKWREAWAWETPDPVIDISMPKAIEIHKDKLREVRKPILESLDVAFMRALEAGDTAEQARIAALKQQLRDVTADPVINSATTVDALTIPAILS